MHEGPAARRPVFETPPILVGLAAVLTTLGLAAILYFGRVVFVPFTLAVILSFLLAPAVRFAQGLGMPRAAAAVVAVALAVAAMGGLAAVIGQQVAGLATDLPRYETTIRQKIAGVRAFAGSGGGFAKAVGTLKNLAEDGLATAGTITGQGEAARPARAAQAPKPMPVEIAATSSDPFTELADLASPLLQPLANFGLIIIFAVFVLIQREDLRNRLISLVGTDDLSRTTAAIDDAGYRLSRLFLTQLAVNGSYGALIGIGLWLIGVPSPVLWAVLAGLLRFIPYVGATMGAVPPILLAVGIDPGWSMLLWSAALFIVVDVTLGQILEPLVYGHSTGISPAAVLVATAVWTFLWGPIGIFLAMPLTVLVVVLGRHVDRLRFLDTILGDRPVLAPHEIFYQRMLAGEPLLAAAKARETLKERALVTYYDEVALPGLRLARRDAGRGSLTGARHREIEAAVQAFLGEIAGAALPPPAADTTHDTEAAAAVEALGPDHAVASVIRRPDQLRPTWRGSRPVRIEPGTGLFDAAAAQMLAQILVRHGLGAAVAPALAEPRDDDPAPAGVALVCLSFADATDLARVRLAARRARRRFPGAAILVGLWDLGGEASADRRRATSADILAASYHEALTGALRLSSREGVRDAA